MELTSRASYRGQITKLVKAASEYLSSAESKVNENLEALDDIEEELEVLLDRLTSAHESLLKANTEAHSSIKPEDFAKDSDAVADYKDKAVGAITRLKHRLSKVRQHQRSFLTETTRESEQTSIVQQNNMHQAVKLKKLFPKRFSGDYKEWVPFWEQYRTLIHENSSLTTIDKFNYLETILVGRAAETLAGLTPTEANYNSAIELLKEEYGDHEKIIDYTMQQLLSTPPVGSKTDSVGLRRLYTSVLTSTRSLTSLGVPSSHYFVMLKGVLLRCIPNDLRIDFHRFDNLSENIVEDHSDNPEDNVAASTASDISSAKSIGDKQVKSLLKFLKREIEALEKAHEAKAFSSRMQHQSSTTSRHVKTAVGLFAAGDNENECLFCKTEDHATRECTGSSNLSEKKQLLRDDGRCFRCCTKGHNSKTCRNKHISCIVCDGRHATSMCDPLFASKTRSHSLNQGKAQTVLVATETTPGEREPTSTSQQSLNLYTAQTTDQSCSVYLQTACAFASNELSNEELFIRCVMDGGSQMSFVKSVVARRLNLPSIGSQNLSLISFGSDKPKPNRLFNKVRLTLRSQYSSRTFFVDAVEVPEICVDVLAVPANDIKTSLNGLPLADARVLGNNPEEGISVLIGADQYWQFAKVNHKRITDKLMALETVFGWTIQGPSQVPKVSALQLHVTSLSVCVCEEVRNFWKLETLGILPISNEHTKNDLSLYISRSGDRYEASLPWKDMGSLHDNYSGAMQRFKSLVRKLFIKGRLLEYDKAVSEMLSSGIAEVAPYPAANERVFYMPHRPVYREDKETTKLRIVFDASAHAPDRHSLNEHLEVGDNSLPNVLTILLNFRIGKIALTADIEKAFLQILLHSRDRDSHRFIWFSERLSNDENLPDIKVFRMTRVTFGVKCSPSLLAAAIKKAIEEAEPIYRRTCAVLRKSFYVDDFVCSVDSELEAVQIQREASIILSGASMNLCKWKCNSSTVRRQLPVDQDISKTQKVLGLQWIVPTDDLSTNVDGVLELLESNELKGTKRDVLQVMAKIFDPLGFLGPWIVRLKILFQSIWRKGLDWNAMLPEEMMRVWTTICNEIKDLRAVAIPRHAFIGKKSVQIHIFADASQHAFGAVAYARTCDEDGKVYVRFLCAKNRVAPLNKKNQNELTIPKLELTAALVAARLLEYLLEILNIKVDDAYLWTDSKITWFWIQRAGKRWKPYIENRVAEIRSKWNVSKWRHCPGSDNPADLVTRGISAMALLNSSLWISGPEWLKKDPAEWPQNDVNVATLTASVICNDSTENDTKQPNGIWNNSEPLIKYKDFSNLRRLLRTTAYFNRAVRSFKTKDTYPNFLLADELMAAEIFWISHVQGLYFRDEITSFLKQRCIGSKSNLATLNPFLDDTDGLLRVGGRLQYAGLETRKAHPIILPKSSHFTKLIVKDVHERLFHAGTNTVLSKLRSKFWIPKGRQLVVNIIKDCFVCKLLRAKAASQPFAPLSRDRVLQSRPFEVTGVDFAGPLHVVDNDNQPRKVYIMLLTCAAIRAVHLEVVLDLTAESCLLALRRFIARRGVPRIIYSDNAKTYKKVSSELSKKLKLNSNKSFQCFLSDKRIKWKFIVERAPWWGGFWERLVGVVKSSLKAAIRRASLTTDQFTTLLTEVENVVNSRPLTYISDDSSDCAPLTPAHFLGTHEDSSEHTSDHNSQPITQPILSGQWAVRLHNISIFKRRWFREYLQQLRSLHHEKQATASYLRPGDVVLLQDSSLPRTLWQLAIIQKTFPGRDGKQLMGQLPYKCANPSRPFLHPGVDYAGPFVLKTWRGQAAKTYKAYLIVFICFSSSAVHLESATDYSTEGFLAAYKRFVSRRGICATLTTDCGTNLVGADAELRKLFKATSKQCRYIIDILSTDGTKWQLNPPSAPHFGGKWETAVKSAKFHIKRSIGESILTYEEFSTLLVQIEAVLNSRPIFPLSDDPDDIDALTPGHFIIGSAINTVPEPSLLHIPESRLSRFQRLWQMLERFWLRWSSQYLQRLQERVKWQDTTASIRVGALVLVVDERYPPTKWPLARVIETHPGSDGLVSVVTVKTQFSTLKRPIVKLCPLPVHHENEEDDQDSTSSKEDVEAGGMLRF